MRKGIKLVLCLLDSMRDEMGKDKNWLDKQQNGDRGMWLQKIKKCAVCNEFQVICINNRLFLPLYCVNVDL